MFDSYEDEERTRVPGGSSPPSGGGGGGFGLGGGAFAGGGVVSLLVLARIGLGIAKIASRSSHDDYTPPPALPPGLSDPRFGEPVAAGFGALPHWTTPRRYTAAQPMDVAAAVKAGTAAGAKPSAKDPDLAGDWKQRDNVGEGLATQMLIHREREAPGVYALVTTSTVAQDGVELIKIETRGFEVISANKECQYANQVEISFAAPEIAQALGESMTADLKPEALNAEPCNDLAHLTPTVVQGTDEGDGGFLEEKIVTTP